MVNAGPPDDLGDLTPVLDEVARSRGLTRFEEIGRGGMGVVVKAWDDITARWVAVKIFSRHGVGRDMGLQRFRKEIRLLASIHHPAIISVYYAGKAGDDVAYFVMEYVDGPNLATLISRRQEEGRPFTVDETVTLLRPVAAALDHLHSLTPPVFHRDIKPANIIVRPVRDGVDAGVLTDFGISLSAEDTRVTSEGMVVGTDHYLAPELFSSDPDTGTRPDRASDIYAFAAVVAEMLTLRTVKSTMSEPAWRFARGVPTYRAGDLAPEDAGRVAVVNRAVADALHPDPARRTRSASAVIDAVAGRRGEGDDGDPARVGAGRARAAGVSPGVRRPGGDGGGEGAGPPRDRTAWPEPRRVDPGRAEPRRADSGRPEPRRAEPRVPGTVETLALPVAGAAGAPAAPGAVSAPGALSAPGTPGAPGGPDRGRVPRGTRRRRRRGVAVLAAVLGVALVASGGLAGYAFVLRPPWPAEDRAVVDAFPGIVPDRVNGTGWAGLTCRPATPEPGQRAKISCSGPSRAVALAEYDDASRRDDAVVLADPQRLSNGRCEVDSGTVGESGDVGVLPRGGAGTGSRSCSPATGRHRGR